MELRPTRSGLQTDIRSREMTAYSVGHRETTSNLRPDLKEGPEQFLIVYIRGYQSRFYAAMPTQTIDLYP